MWVNRDQLNTAQLNDFAIYIRIQEFPFEIDLGIERSNNFPVYIVIVVEDNRILKGHVWER